MASNFGSLDTLVNRVAQDIAIRLKARSVSYNLETETYSYYCHGEVTHTFTKNDLMRFVKGEINKKINFIK